MANRKVVSEKPWTLWRLTDDGLAALALTNHYTNITKMRIAGKRVGETISTHETQEEAIAARIILSPREQGRTLMVSTRLI